MMIAQHHTDAPSRPIITSLTTILACQNRLNRDMSCATGTAWATSAGFISFVLALRAAPRESPRPTAEWSRKILCLPCSFARESVENKGGDSKAGTDPQTVVF